ncbi:MAG: BON domain-containing protein [Gammaproteobacteria bacterium]
MKTKPIRLIGVALVALPLIAACDRAERSPADRADTGDTTMNGAPSTAVPTPAPSERVGEDTVGEKVERVGEAMEAQGEKIGAAIDDAAVTARVKAALVADPDLSALEIDVDSKDGVVTLRGSVESSAASERAGTLARDTEGVVSVDNQLVVAALN